MNDNWKELHKALYGKEAAQHYIGGSEDRMLHDGAKVVKAARALVNFWNGKSGPVCDVMQTIVSAKAKEDALISSLPNNHNRNRKAK